MGETIIKSQRMIFLISNIPTITKYVSAVSFVKRREIKADSSFNGPVLRRPMKLSYLHPTESKSF